MMKKEDFRIETLGPREQVRCSGCHRDVKGVGSEYVVRSDKSNACLRCQIADLSPAAGLEDALTQHRDAAFVKAWHALARYKFLMFGYWAAIWVHLNRIHPVAQGNPWSDLVHAGRQALAKRDDVDVADWTDAHAGHEQVADDPTTPDTPAEPPRKKRDRSSPRIPDGTKVNIVGSATQWAGEWGIVKGSPDPEGYYAVALWGGEEQPIFVRSELRVAKDQGNR